MAWHMVRRARIGSGGFPTERLNKLPDAERPAAYPHYREFLQDFQDDDLVG